MKIEDILQEDVAFSQDVTISDVLKAFDAAKRAVSIMNRLKNLSEKKKHASAIFKNMNRIRGMIMRLTEPVQE